MHTHTYNNSCANLKIQLHLFCFTVISKFRGIYCRVQSPQSEALFEIQGHLNTLMEGCLHHPYLQVHPAL